MMFTSLNTFNTLMTQFFELKINVYTGESQFCFVEACDKVSICLMPL